MYWYLLKKIFVEGIQNIKRHSFMSLASGIIIFVAMVFLNIFILTTFNIHSLSQQINNEIKIDTFVDKDINEVQLEELKEKLLDLQNVEDVIFVSKHQSINKIASNYGKVFENLKGESNPLYDKYEITVKKNKGIKKTNEQIKKMDYVFQSVYGKDTVEEILKMSNYFRKFSSVFLVTTNIFVILILFITLSMGIKTRQEEIKTRTLLGATPLFISIPFIFQSLLITMSWGGVASVVTLKVYHLFSDRINDLIGSWGYTFVTWKEAAVYICSISLGVSFFIGIITAIVSTRRNIYYPN